MEMKTATEYIRVLRYKLCMMMGIPIEGLIYIFRDNKHYLVNLSHPESTMKKKKNSIAYHNVHEGYA